MLKRFIPLKITLIFLSCAALLIGSECAAFIHQPEQNHFVLVIDRSGSMKGEPIIEAKKAANHFIESMKANDFASIIAFSNTIESITGFTSSKSKLKNSVSKIKAGGGTKLYDAIGKAAMSLIGEKGPKIIIFLTDGEDTGSAYNINNLKNMNLSEGIFLYGIGLGSVNTKALEKITDASGGNSYITNNPSDLTGIYDKILDGYYTEFGNRVKQTASLTIRSFPSSQQVLINGRVKGNTPIKLDGLEVIDYNVQIQFQRGVWECDVDTKAGYLASIDARESDLGYDLTVVSSPKGASVFLDDTYAGITSFQPVSTIKKRAGIFGGNKEVKLYDNELVIPLIPAGKHNLKIIAIPDFEFGSEQVFEFSFQILNKDRIVEIDIFDQKAEFINGEIIRGRPLDPFKDLE